MDSLKLVQKQMKTLIPSMSESDLKRITKHLENVLREEFLYTSKELSYKCYEGIYTFKNKKATGYGRTDQDAHLNAIKNLMEILVEEDDIVFILKHQIRMGNREGEEGNKENQPMRGYSTKPSINLSASISTQSNTNTNNPNAEDNKKSRSLIKPIHVETLNISMLKSTSTKPTLEQQLEAAKMYIIKLEEKIRLVEQENRNLKGKGVSSHGLQASYFAGTLPNATTSVHLQLDNPRFSLKAKDTKPVYVRNQKLNYSVQEIPKDPEAELRKSEAKQKVPKLKLSLLPSFHGKSNKSMNQSLLVKEK